jgi:hypothetical protein
MNIPEVVHTVHPFPLKLFGFWTFFNTCLMFQWKICTSKKLDFHLLVIVFILANEWYCFPKMFIVYKLVWAKQIWSNPPWTNICNVIGWDLYSILIYNGVPYFHLSRWILTLSTMLLFLDREDLNIPLIDTPCSKNGYSTTIE